MLLSVGCSKKPDQADPIATIQDRARYLENYFNIEHREDSGGKQYTVKDISYDVEKTQSLVSPLAGTIEFLMLENGAPSCKEKVQLAWQDGRWVVKSAIKWYFVNGEWQEFPFPKKTLAQAKLYLGLD